MSHNPCKVVPASLTTLEPIEKPSIDISAKDPFQNSDSFLRPKSSREKDVKEMKDVSETDGEKQMVRVNPPGAFERARQQRLETLRSGQSSAAEMQDNPEQEKAEDAARSDSTKDSWRFTTLRNVVPGRHNLRRRSVIDPSKLASAKEGFSLKHKEEDDLAARYGSVDVNPYTLRFEEVLNHDPKVLMRGSSTPLIANAGKAFDQKMKAAHKAERRQVPELESSFIHLKATNKKPIMQRAILAFIAACVFTLITDVMASRWYEHDFRGLAPAVNQTTINYDLKSDDELRTMVIIKVGIFLPVCVGMLVFTQSAHYLKFPDLLGAGLGGQAVVIALWSWLSTTASSDTRTAIYTLYMFILFFYTPARTMVVLMINLFMVVCFTAVNISKALGHAPVFPGTATSEQSPPIAVVEYILMVAIGWVIMGYASYTTEFVLRKNHVQQVRRQLQQTQLHFEEKLSETLLRSMLPEAVLLELKEDGHDDNDPIADDFSDVTVLFCMIEGFGDITAKLDPQTVVTVLNIIYSTFDVLVERHSVHKVETVGEVYMCVCGCPIQLRNHAALCGEMSLDMVRHMPMVRQQLVDQLPLYAEALQNINIQIGLNSGPIVAGVVGLRNPRFKLFGDVVNTSSRMESTSKPGKIQVSESTFNRLTHTSGVQFTFLKREKIEVKGKGKMQTYFLEGAEEGGKVNCASEPMLLKHQQLMGYGQRTLKDVLHRMKQQKARQTIETHHTRARNGKGSKKEAKVQPDASTTPETQETLGDPASSPTSDGGKARSHARGRTSVADRQSRWEAHSEADQEVLTTFRKSPTEMQQQHVEALIDVHQKNLINAAAGPGAVTAGGPRKRKSNARALGLELSSASKYDMDQVTNEPGTPTFLANQGRMDSGTVAMLKSDIEAKTGSLTLSQKTATNPEKANTAESGEALGTAMTFESKTQAYKQLMMLGLANLPEPVLPVSQELWIMLGLRRLSFNPGTTQELAQEASYLASYFDTNTIWTRMMSKGVVTFMILLIILDITIAKDLSEKARILRLTICLVQSLLAIIYYALTYNRNWIYHHSRHTILWFSCTAIGLVVHPVSIALEQTGPPAYGLVLLFVIAEFQTSLICFLHRTLLAMFIIILYLVVVLFTDAGPERDIPWQAFSLIMIFFFTLWPSYTSERQNRIMHNNQLIIERQHELLLEEQRRSEQLLQNLLPPSVVTQLKQGVKCIAESFKSVSIIFTDMKGFTAYSSKVTPVELVSFLNKMYSGFDRISLAHGVYKVEIIGDAYYAVAGCPDNSDIHAVQAARASLLYQMEMPALRAHCREDINIRIGIHTGPCVAGVVGIKDPRYHLFGDSVLLANQMESHGEPNEVHISETTYREIVKCRGHWLSTDEFEFEDRGEIDVKGRGKQHTWFIRSGHEATTHVESYSTNRIK